MNFFEKLHSYIFETVFLGNSIKGYIDTILIIFISILVAYIVGIVLGGYLKRVTKKTESPIDDRLAHLISGLVSFFIVITGFWLGYESLSVPEEWRYFVNAAFVIICTIYIAFALSKHFQFFVKEVLGAKSDRDKMLNPSSVHFISKMGRLVIWVVAFIVLITNLGYDLTSIVTGLGLGGLAFALAAQETLSGLFGYLSIYTDKPFKIGDWVTFGEKSGTVKDVGMRTTRLKTIDGSSVVIPNNKISNDIVENFSRRATRRVDLILKFKATNKASKIKKFKSDIEKVLTKNDFIKDNFYIYSDDLRESFMVINITYHVTKPSDYRNYTVVKDYVNTEAHKLIEKAKLELASSAEGLIELAPK